MISQNGQFSESATVNATGIVAEPFSMRMWVSDFCEDLGRALLDLGSSILGSIDDFEGFSTTFDRIMGGEREESASVLLDLAGADGICCRFTNPLELS
jgi:hypothetical protein